MKKSKILYGLVAMFGLSVAITSCSSLCEKCNDEKSSLIAERDSIIGSIESVLEGDDISGVEEEGPEKAVYDPNSVVICLLVEPHGWPQLADAKLQVTDATQKQIIGLNQLSGAEIYLKRTGGNYTLHVNKTGAYDKKRAQQQETFDDYADLKFSMNPRVSYFGQPSPSPILIGSSDARDDNYTEKTAILGDLFIEGAGDGESEKFYLHFNDRTKQTGTFYFATNGKVSELTYRKNEPSSSLGVSAWGCP